MYIALHMICLLFLSDFNKTSTFSIYFSETLQYKISPKYVLQPPRWWLHLIMVRRFEYASDPESYTSGSVALVKHSNIKFHQNVSCRIQAIPSRRTDQNDKAKSHFGTL